MSTVVRVDDGAAPAASSQGTSRILVVGGILAILAIAGGAVWYFLIRKRTPAPPPSDSPGNFKDWVPKAGYVGSLETVKCAEGDEGLLCENGKSYGVCRQLTGNPSGQKTVCVTPSPTEPQTDQDCAKACSNNGGWRALFHTKDAPQGKLRSRDDLAFDSNICLCYGEPKTFWDRCVPKNQDDKGWKLWSTPDHQKECDRTGLFAVQGYTKGTDGITPTETIHVPNLEACKVEVAGRLMNDNKAYAVYDSASNSCYVKTDDPEKNTFHDCTFHGTELQNMQLVSKLNEDDLKNLTVCPSVKAIQYHGKLPDYFLQAAVYPNVKPPNTSSATEPSAADCGNACATMDNTYGLPWYSRPAFTWEDSTCTCYDFPGSKQDDKDVWRCAYWGGDPENPPPAKVLYVRNSKTDPLYPFDDNSVLPNVLVNCNDDGSVQPPRANGKDCDNFTCTGAQDQKTCNMIHDDSGDVPHCYCMYSQNNWTARGGNAMFCNKCEARPDICVDGTAVILTYADNCDSNQTCGADECANDLCANECQVPVVARCTSANKIQGSPCGLDSDCNEKNGLYCDLTWKGQHEEFIPRGRGVCRPRS